MTTKKFTVVQLTLSTAEDQANQFNGEVCKVQKVPPTPSLPSGDYRVINGELYRIAGGQPVLRG